MIAHEAPVRRASKPPCLTEPAAVNNLAGAVVHLQRVEIFPLMSATATHRRQPPQLLVTKLRLMVTVEPVVMAVPMAQQIQMAAVKWRHPLKMEAITMGWILFHVLSAIQIRTEPKI